MPLEWHWQHVAWAPSASESTEKLKSHARTQPCTNARTYSRTHPRRARAPAYTPAHPRTRAHANKHAHARARAHSRLRARIRTHACGRMHARTRTQARTQERKNARDKIACANPDYSPQTVDSSSPQHHISVAELARPTTAMEKHKCRVNTTFLTNNTYCRGDSTGLTMKCAACRGEPVVKNPLCRDCAEGKTGADVKNECKAATGSSSSRVLTFSSSALRRQSKGRSGPHQQQGTLP